MQITCPNVTLEVEEYGPQDGPALILIRGLGTQLVHWPKELFEGFAGLGYRTVIFDNRDVGLSQRFPMDGVKTKAEDILAQIREGITPMSAYSLGDMAQDVISLMDSLGIAKAHIFGISMGGAIAQVLAMDHSDRLLSNTIVMTSARLRGMDLFERVVSYPETRDEAQDNWVKGHAEWGSPGYPMPEEEIRSEAALAWDRGADADGINRQAIATLTAPDRREALKNVTLPCLVIHGEEDTLIPPEMGREIAKLIPACQLEIIKGMGHVITPLLAPKIVEMVNGFIKARGLSA